MGAPAPDAMGAPAGMPGEESMGAPEEMTPPAPEEDRMKRESVDYSRKLGMLLAQSKKK